MLKQQLGDSVHRTLKQSVLNFNKIDFNAKKMQAFLTALFLSSFSHLYFEKLNLEE